MLFPELLITFRMRVPSDVSDVFCFSTASFRTLSLSFFRLRVFTLLAFGLFPSLRVAVFEFVLDIGLLVALRKTSGRCDDLRVL
jgi:hypothetical protein